MGNFSGCLFCPVPLGVKAADKAGNPRQSLSELCHNCDLLKIHKQRRIMSLLISAKKIIIAYFI